MSKLSEIRVGRIYAYDPENMLKTLHSGTTTVRVLEIVDRGPLSSPLARVKSVQTGEEFSCDVDWLQLPTEYMRRKFLSLRKWYKRHNPAMLFRGEHRDNRLFAVVCVQKNLNSVKAVDSSGIVRTFDLAWTKLNVKRNGAYDRKRQREWEEYEQDFDHMWDDDDMFDDDTLPA